MIADLLLRPDNRLLGGATGDFSLFGGQPVPGVTFAREAVANGHVSIAAPAADAMPSGASVIGSGSPANPVDEIPAERGVEASAGASPPTATPDPSDPGLNNLIPNATPTPELSVTGLAALGLANSIPTPPPATADVVPDPLAAANTGFDAPTLDQLVPMSGALIAMVASTADIVSGLAEATTPVTQALADSVIDPLATGVADVLNAVDPVAKPVTDIVEPVVDGLAGTIDPVTSRLAAVAAPAVATIGDGAAPLGAALGGTLDAVVPAVASVTPAVDAVIDVVAPVVNAATPVVDVVADTVVPVASAAAPVTAPIADAVQPTGVALQPAADAVATITGDALGGSDPEGGVQTLIGMVANADAFDVIAPGTASAEEPAPSVIDDLIGDVSEVAPLLGDQDGAHDDDGTDLLSGHGGLGLG